VEPAVGYLQEMVDVADPVELAYIDEGAESLFGVCEEGGRVGCVGDQTTSGSLVTVTADKSQDLLACVFQGRWTCKGAFPGFVLPGE
jgi:hypothetical protein